MLRKMISVHLFAAVVCFAAADFATAGCGSCGGNCGGACGAVSGCPGGCGGSCGGAGCISNLLGKFHGGGQDVGGPCMTCDNIWDDYCASKKQCLPQAKYPFQNHSGCGLCRGGGCGACAGGVGIYGQCGAGGCGGGGLLGKLFKHKGHGHGCADGGCLTGGCASGDCGTGGCADGGCDAGVAISAPVAPIYSTAPVAVEAAPMQTMQPMQHAYPVEQPAPQYHQPMTPVSAPMDVPAAAPTLAPSEAVPPTPTALPSVTDQSQQGKRGSFDWLQQALQMN